MTSVSIVLTLRSEPQERVDGVLAAVAAQGVGSEIVVALGADDRARLRLPADVLVVDNPGGRRSPGLNAAVRAASGEVVCRVDARSRPGSDYARRTAERLAVDSNIGVVGGVQQPVAAGPGAVPQGIARALGNPWALGGARYRRGGGGPVDTVYLGTYRRPELLELGGFNEDLDANEDFELCQRYRAAGLAVWLEDGLIVPYEVRATYTDVWKQYRAFGASKVAYWRTTGSGPNTRQALALGAGGVATMAGVAGLRRPGRLLGLAVGGLAALAALDHVGGPDDADLAVRAASVLAYGPIVGGWVAGVARAVLR